MPDDALVTASSADDGSAASSAVPDTQVTLTVAEQAVVSGDQEAFRAARRAERAGKPVTPPVGSAASAPAKPVEQAPSTDGSSSPASEPGKSSGHKGNAETRKAELQRDIDELLTQRATLRREVDQLRQPPPTKPDSQAASAPASVDSEDAEPTLDMFESDPAKYPDPYTAYVDARSRWVARQEVRAQQSAFEAVQSEQQRVEGFRSRIDTETKKDPGWFEKLSDEVKGLRTLGQAKAAGEPVGPLTVAAERLLDSPIAPALMRHWTEHPEALAELKACRTPNQVVYALALQEATLAIRLSKASDPPAKTVEAPKTLTDMAPPPTTLGQRPAEPSDEVDAAVAAGDVARFRAARLAQRVARLK